MKSPASVRRALGFAVGVLFASSVSAAITQPDGRSTDIPNAFASAVRLGGPTVRIEVRQTTEVDGQPRVTSHEVVDLDFSASRGRTATLDPAPAEVRFDHETRWLRVATPSAATAGKAWIEVPPGAADAPYDFASHADPTRGTDLVLGATAARRQGSVTVGGRSARVYSVDFEPDRVAERAGHLGLDSASIRFSTLDLGSLDAIVSIDGEGRLAEVRYSAQLRKEPGSTIAAKVLWEATYNYRVPVDVSRPEAIDSLVEPDPARAVQLAGVSRIGS